MTDKERAVDWVLKNGATCLQNNMSAYEFAEQAYLAGFNADRWKYPSKGELPDKDVECLVCTTSGNNFIAMIDSSDKCWCTGEFFSESLRDDCVECWQYIVPPKEEL